MRVGSGGKVDADAASSFARVRRRLTFGPFPGQVARDLDRFANSDELVEALLAAPPLPFTTSVQVADRVVEVDLDALGVEPTTDEQIRVQVAELAAFRRWWVDRMRSDEASIHERMMWFWHGVFTTSIDKVGGSLLCWRQLRTLHELAMGSLADLAEAMTVDGAMLVYLDGSGSAESAPNENYARELMELFLLGLGTFDQHDVVAAARALSGWHVEFPDTYVEFLPDRGPSAPVEFLGVRKQYDVASLLARILDQDACAPFVVTKLWYELVGGAPDTAVVAEWARQFRRSGYDIAGLVGNVVRSDAFRAAAVRRPVRPIEWYCSVTRVTGDLGRDPSGDLSRLAQCPYLPPNVAGWPRDDAWLSPSHTHARAVLLSQLELPEASNLAGAPDLVGTVLDRCSLASVSASTRGALDALAARLLTDATVSRAARAATVLTAVLLSPEFSFV